MAEPKCSPDMAVLLNDELAYLRAYGTLSATLLCGCRWPPSDPVRIRELVHPGCRVTCTKHGATVIIRTTVRLTTPFGVEAQPQPRAAP